MSNGAGMPFNYTPVVGPANPNGDFEITNPPNDIISAMEFSPASLQKTLLVASVYDQTVRLWDLKQSGQNATIAMHIQKTVLDVCWAEEGKNIFLASSDNQLKLWDVESKVLMVWKGHRRPIKTCNLINGPGYESCVMTGSWDNTLKIWDIRQKAATKTIYLCDTISLVDVVYPLAVVCTESGDVFVYNIERTIELVKRLVPPFESERYCVAIFKDKITKKPTGFCVGSSDGRVFTVNIENPTISSDILTSNRQNNMMVNNIKFHPVHDTLAIVRANGRYSYWDTEPQFRLKISKKLDQPITKCCFDSSGKIFAYSTGCDWTMDNYKDPTIYINNRCFDEMKPFSWT